MNPVPFHARFRIGRDHPALPGHFPGHAVVPGVVLLDRVAAALESWRGARIAGLPQVKFLAPLLPEQEAEIVLHDDGKSIHFSIFHAGSLIASGIANPASIDSTARGTPA